MSVFYSLFMNDTYATYIYILDASFAQYGVETLFNVQWYLNHIACNSGIVNFDF